MIWGEPIINPAPIRANSTKNISQVLPLGQTTFYVLITAIYKFAAI